MSMAQRHYPAFRLLSEPRPPGAVIWHRRRRANNLIEIATNRTAIWMLARLVCCWRPTPMGLLKQWWRKLQPAFVRRILACSATERTLIRQSPTKCRARTEP